MIYYVEARWSAFGEHRNGQLQQEAKLREKFFQIDTKQQPFAWSLFFPIFNTADVFLRNAFSYVAAESAKE